MMCRKLIYLFSLVLLLGPRLYGSPQPDTIRYDDGNALNIDINQNALFAVRFTPVRPFNLMAIYLMVRNDYNAADGCALWVAQDKGGLPDWPATYVGYVPPPLPNETWIQFDLAGPMYLDDDFFVVVRQLGGFSPGPGFWIALDWGTDTYRTVKSYSNGQAWLDEPLGDALIRVGGMYDTGQPLADYGDASDPGFPTLYATQSTPYVNRRGPYHLDVTKEWIGTATPSTTTTEARALVVDGDFDDGAILARRAVVSGIPTQIGFVSVPVTVAAGSGADMRYLNVLVDFNRDGRWSAYDFGGATVQEEWVAKNVALMFPGKKTLVRANVPFVWLDPGIVIGSQVWLRATLSTETINPSVFGNGNPGWDGSGPDAGFARGETEDHIVTLTTFAFHPVPPGWIEPHPVPPLPPGPGPDGGPGPAPGPDPGPGKAAEPIDKAKKHPVPDITQEPNECGPTSAANSLYYLAAAYGFSEKLPGSPEHPRELIELLKKKMNWTIKGVTADGFINGKKTIAEELDLPIVTTHKDASKGKVPDPAWIMAELKRCEDVELGMIFDKGGGHLVTATGYARYPNGDIVIELHDPDDNLDGEAVYRLGDRGDGYPSLLDYPLLNRIKLAIAESPRCITGGPEGDLNKDCIVDFDDVAILAGNWLAECMAEPECFPVSHPDYEMWVTVGKPDCWCCPGQCHGDTNCDQTVDDRDLSGIEPLIGMEYRDDAYEPCFDFDHNGRIGSNDLNTVLHWYNKQVPGDCLGAW